MFKALVGDRAYRDYFAVWSSDAGGRRFRPAARPRGCRAVTLAAYTGSMSGAGTGCAWRGTSASSSARGAGSAYGSRISAPGTSGSRRPGRTEGVPLPEASASRRSTTTLDVRSARKVSRLDGTAPLQLEALDTGRRTLSLELFRDLEIIRRRREGRELFAFRSGPEVVVQLPEPTRAGDRLTLRRRLWRPGR